MHRQLCALALVALGLCATDPAAGGGTFPLRVAGRELVSPDGTPFRVVGDAPWTLLAALTVPEADEYLAARRAAGFNTILVELVEPHFAGPRNRYGDVPFAGGDFTRPVDAYFSHATAVLDLALKHGFLVLLTPAYIGWQCGEQGYCQQMLATPEPVLEAYGRYVGTLLARYPNIVWVHGGDADAGRYGALPKVEAVYRGINAVQPGGLHTAHCARNLSALDCYDRPWLNVNTTYSDCEQTPARVLADRERTGDMPSIYIEGRYEEEKSTPPCVRAQLWWSYLGGSVGHVFGNKRIWRFEPDWRSALDTPGARAMTVASRLMAKTAVAGKALVAVPLAASTIQPYRLQTAWARLVAEPRAAGRAWSGLVASEEEIPVATSGSATVAYLPHFTHFRYTGPDRTFCWIDPRTGAVTQAPGPDRDFSSPDGQDWLFVAEPAARVCGRKTV